MEEVELRLKEKTLSSREIYQGRIVHLRVDQVALPNGGQAGREVVDHPGAVVILPVTDEGQVIMVRQYRYPVGKVLLELPAGKREADERPLDCGRRELGEETGYRARDWREICSFYTSPGFCNELIYLLLAEGLEPGESHPDDEEFIDTVTVSVEEARRLILSGGIQDAKTQIGILALATLIK